MSMEPQTRPATGPSTFTVLNRYTDKWNRDRAKVQGPYGTSEMEVHEPHEGCGFGGYNLWSRSEWAEHLYCTGCNYSVYYPLGD